ncbi:MAG TPA: BON domain-containing protein [Actinomycetota bacterium]|nr:BON domain-containing protein [Actinomycetota bacterium]
MAVDVDVLEQIRERLRVSTRVGDERIEVATRDNDVVLLGAVATPEEATVAGQLAEEYATSVVNELQVDRGLREGVEEPLDTEPASPAGDEVLVGSTDMLAGPETVPTEDLAEALDENEPWTPPDVPQLAPTATEQRGGVPPSDALALSEWEEGGDPDDLLDEEDRAARDGISAPDLAQADLDRAAEGGQLPSLDPTAATPGGDPEAEPEPFESGTWADDMVEQVPGTAKGPGAVGEYETEGGELGSVPALETGAIGADTAPSDPARDASGGVEKMAGTDRGPAAHEDRAIRAEIEDDDAIENDD